MSKSSNTLPPGTPTPRSGIYEQVGPRGGRTGEQARFDARAPSAAHGKSGVRLDPGSTRPSQRQKVSHSKSASGRFTFTRRDPRRASPNPLPSHPGLFSTTPMV